MKALIVDDEPLARMEMRRMLRAHPEVQIVGEAGDGMEAIGMVEQLSPDVLFLDVQMPGMTGFELLGELRGEVPQVIFTTAYDQHAIRAFEVNALDYLLKPIAPERLAAALRRVSPPRVTRNLSQIFVRDGERCWIVKIPEIFLLESEDNYTRLHFGNCRPLIRRSLGALEEQLDAAVFFRANRKQIINLNWIENTGISSGGGLTAVLRGGQVVELSRRQFEKLRSMLSL